MKGFLLFFISSSITSSSSSAYFSSSSFSIFFLNDFLFKGSFILSSLKREGNDVKVLYGEGMRTLERKRDGESEGGEESGREEE